MVGRRQIRRRGHPQDRPLPRQRLCLCLGELSTGARGGSGRTGPGCRRRCGLIGLAVRRVGIRAQPDLPHGPQLGWACRGAHRHRPGIPRASGRRRLVDRRRHSPGRRRSRSLGESTSCAAWRGVRITGQPATSGACRPRRFAQRQKFSHAQCAVGGPAGSGAVAPGSA